MKIFLASGIYFFLTLSATLMPQIVQGCEIYEHSKNRISELNCIIDEYQDHVSNYNNIYFHFGYLHGQRQTHFEVIRLIDTLYPN